MAAFIIFAVIPFSLSLIYICFLFAWAKEEGPKTLYCGKYLDLKTFEGWEYVERSNTDRVAFIIPLFVDEHGGINLIFIKEFRVPFQKYVVSFPAGLVGDKDCNESILSGARRELLEETGYTADVLLPITRGSTSAGLSNEVLDFFLATNLKKQEEAKGDGTEKIDVHVVSVNNAYKWLEDQSFLDKHLIDSKVYLGMYFVCKFLGKVI